MNLKRNCNLELVINLLHASSILDVVCGTGKSLGYSFLHTVSMQSDLKILRLLFRCRLLKFIY
jgi:hypothetical protein